uniref:DNA-directed RNA polymerase subunit beta n=2 Tax=Anthurium amnicola TaxID=1678845 RepID=A0A1D1YDU8_9ARAE
MRLAVAPGDSGGFRGSRGETLRALGSGENADPLLLRRIPLATTAECRNMQSRSKNARSSKRVDKNFKWTRAMTRLMITGLVEQAMLGMKVDKGFKRRAYAGVARQVTERFGEECMDNNVENRFKTLKRNWSEIKKLRQLTGHVFDEINKIIILDDMTAAEYTKANPKAEPFINQPIEMYDELSIVCGDEKPTGLYSRSGEPLSANVEGSHEDAHKLVLNGEVANENQNEEIDNSSLQGSETPSSPDVIKQSKGRAKRARSYHDKSYRDKLDEKLEMLAEKIGYMAEQIGRDMKKEHADALHEAVMSCKGYTEAWLLDAYGHLLDNKTQGNVFMRSSHPMRQHWLKEYFTKRYQ